MKILRVFPRRTSATPDDEFVRIGPPSLFDTENEADEIHVSVTFAWDLPEAEKLARLWVPYGPVKIGGPATGMAGDEFVPGKYLRSGYTITSRGCPNNCWFCTVPGQEGSLRELPIRDGWNVLDDNLLACSDEHIHKVFEMLARQKHRAEFTGGLEAARLKYWHVKALKELNPQQIFFAYDDEDDRDSLYEAGELLHDLGFKIKNPLRAYVLIGYPGDTLESAEWRLRDAISAGFLPMAMLYRSGNEIPTLEWRRFQKPWARPAAMYSKMKEVMA